MGNEQSTPGSSRTANKLSKPRTNSSSDLLTAASKSALTSASKAALSHRNSQSDDADRLEVDQDQVMEDGTETNLETERCKPTKRSSRRMSLQLFRSRSSRAQSEIVTEQVNTVDTDPLPARARASRSNSMVSESTTEKPAESKSFMERPLFKRTRMSLQHIPHSHKTRLSLVTEVKTPEPEVFASFESANSNDDATPASARSSIERCHTQRAHKAIRRRSMLQHGVATRISVARRSSEDNHGEDAHELCCQPVQPQIWPGAPSEASESDLEHRAETPTEFQHLGAFKLGTLRITNGAASPSSSVASTTADDYVSAKTTHVHHLPPRSHTYSVPPQAKHSWIRAQSPLRREHLRNQPELAVTVPDPSLALFRFSDDMSPKALDPAQQRQLGSPVSPFSLKPSLQDALGLEATSKHTAIEDDLFEIEAASPLHSSGFMSSDAVQSFKNGRKSAPPGRLAKADSGYSSNVSLQSLNQERSPTIPPTDIHHVSTIWTHTSRDRSLRRISRNSLPTINPGIDYQDLVRTLPAVPQESTKLQSSTQASVGVQTVVHTSFKHSEPVPREREQSLSLPTGTPQPLEDQCKEDKVAASSVSRWRLLRKRSSQKLVPSKPVFTVKADVTAGEGDFLPRVPVEASEHLDAQVDEFPTHSLPSLMGFSQAQPILADKRASSTAALPGSPDALREQLRRARREALSPPAHDKDHLAWKPQRSQTSYEVPRPTQGSWNQWQHAPLPAQPRRYQSQEDFVDAVTSLNAINSSLGASSYDAASHAAGMDSASEQRARAMTLQQKESVAAHFARVRAEHLNFLQEIHPPPSTMPTSRPQTRRQISFTPAAASSTPDLHASIQAPPMYVDPHKRNPPISMQTMSRPPVRQFRSTPNTPQSTSHSNATAPIRKGSEPLVPDIYPSRNIPVEASAAQTTDQRIQRGYAAEDRQEQVVCARRSIDIAQSERRPLQRPSMSRLNHRVTFDTFGTYNRPADEARQYYGEEHQEYSSHYHEDARHPLQVPSEVMLVMDRYADNLGHGDLIPRAGLDLRAHNEAFSEGDRKELHASERYGVDLGNGPAFELEA